MAVIYWVTAIYRAVSYRFDSHCSLKNTVYIRGRSRLVFLVGFCRAREVEIRDSSKTGVEICGIESTYGGISKTTKRECFSWDYGIEQKFGSG